jgi:TonB family protein
MNHRQPLTRFFLAASCSAFFLTCLEGQSADADTKVSTTDASNVVLTDPYLTSVERRVEKHWHPDNASSGSTCCAFVIGKMGDVAHVRLVKSSGNAVLDQAAVKAIDSSIPFKPVPKRLDSISVKIVFDKDATSKKLTTTND